MDTDDADMPRSPTGHPSPTGSQEQFAAALTAKLDSLTDTSLNTGCHSSPDDIGLDCESPNSMETQAKIIIIEKSSEKCSL